MTTEQVISDAGQAELLRIARRAVEAAARDDPAPDCASNVPGLEQHLGAFVTLTQRGRLRGCIGQFTADQPVREVVGDMAKSAAVNDPRFDPVRERDLREIEIEISVLSPMVRTDDPLSLELGVHGIYIKRGWRSGTFLPQVATEHGMSKEEFLSSCCAHKAGLPPDAWRDPETEVYLYTAQVFGEK